MKRIVEVTVDSEWIYVRLRDRVEAAFPRAMYPKLRDATPEQLANWQVIGNGEGIHWPDLDEDLKIR